MASDLFDDDNPASLIDNLLNSDGELDKIFDRITQQEKYTDEQRRAAETLRPLTKDIEALFAKYRDDIMKNAVQATVSKIKETLDQDAFDKLTDENKKIVESVLAEIHFAEALITASSLAMIELIRSKCGRSDIAIIAECISHLKVSKTSMRAVERVMEQQKKQREKLHEAPEFDMSDKRVAEALARARSASSTKVH